MYSVVLLAAMSTPGDATAFGKKGGCYGGCTGCYGGTIVYGCTGCYGSCHGSSCHGGGFLGLRNKHSCHGSSCYGGCTGCYGGCFGSSCYGGCTGSCYGGCYGGGVIVGGCTGSCYGGCGGIIYSPAPSAPATPATPPAGGMAPKGGAALPPAPMPAFGNSVVIPAQPARVD